MVLLFYASVCTCSHLMFLFSVFCCDAWCLHSNSLNAGKFSDMEDNNSNLDLDLDLDLYWLVRQPLWPPTEIAGHTWCDSKRSVYLRLRYYAICVAFKLILKNYMWVWICSNSPFWKSDGPIENKFYDSGWLHFYFTTLDRDPNDDQSNYVKQYICLS